MKSKNNEVSKLSHVTYQWKEGLLTHMLLANYVDLSNICFIEMESVFSKKLTSAIIIQSFHFFAHIWPIIMLV